MVAKKMGIDIYMIHMITLITSQYNYISNELENLFEESLRTDINCKNQTSIKRDINRLIRQHGMVLRVCELLKSQLSLNVAVTYFNCTCRYCFLAYMFVGFPSSYFDKLVIIMYAVGSFVQVFMLCSSAQGLLDASMTVTESAFYKYWYNFPLRYQRVFAIMMISTKLVCKLSAFGIADLTLGTFVLILRQSYSAFLFLLNVNS